MAEGVKMFKGVVTQRAMARAMERLSQDTHNCFVMHQYGILKVGSPACTITGLSPRRDLNPRPSGCGGSTLSPRNYKNSWENKGQLLRSHKLVD